MVSTRIRANHCPCQCDWEEWNPLHPCSQLPFHVRVSARIWLSIGLGREPRARDHPSARLRQTHQSGQPEVPPPTFLPRTAEMQCDGDLFVLVEGRMDLSSVAHIWTDATNISGQPSLRPWTLAVSAPDPRLCSIAYVSPQLHLTCTCVFPHRAMTMIRAGLGH